MKMLIGKWQAFCPDFSELNTQELLREWRPHINMVMSCKLLIELWYVDIWRGHRFLGGICGLGGPPVAHYDDVIMDWIASQITSLPVVCSIVYSDVNQRKHQSSASLAFVREIHRGPVNFPHKWPVTRKMFPFDDVIMLTAIFINVYIYTYVSHHFNLLCMTHKQ